MLGQIEEGLRALAEALEIAHNSGERFYEAELYRLRGELLLTRTVPGVGPAEENFIKALEIARMQQMKSLELKAAMSLSRLWQSQGRGEQARRLLVEIYSWFTEGF